MAESLSPDHVFDFPKDDSKLSEEEFEEEPEEKPEEEPKEEPEDEPKDELEEGHVEITRVSPITPPLISDSSSDSEFTAPIATDRAVWMPPSGSTFKVGGPSSASTLPPHLFTREVKRLREDIKPIHSSVRCLEQGARTHQSEDAATHATRTTNHVLALEEDNRRLRRPVDSLEVSSTLAAMNRDRFERDFSSLRARVTERLGGGAVEARPSECIDVMAIY
ncbi:hypothetical protein Tco_1533902 [Tanacetum coccineum]